VKRSLLFAILLYVTLDLSMAMMPGAFVFDVADSVESVQLSRGRAAAELVVVPAPVREANLQSHPRMEIRPRLVAQHREQRRERRVAHRSWRSPGDAGRPRHSEDPH
jgi:hypothetical protein